MSQSTKVINESDVALLKGKLRIDALISV